MAEAGGSSVSVTRGRALLLVALGVAGTGGSCLLAALGVEPFATWLYPFAWYSLLLALEGAVALRRGSFFVLERPRAVLSLLLWSVPFWMLFEVIDFRVRNWYYVLVPEERALAWLGITISFATVLPAVYLPAALTGLGEGTGEEEGVVPDGHGGAPGGGSSLTRGGTPLPGTAPFRRLAPPGLRIAGLLFLVLSLVWPRIFFPLIWGAPFLLAEGELTRHAPAASLVVDLRRSRSGRILALLLGGALAGLFWESLNWMARARWIYTVPRLEELKLFEMPLLGFIGFPVLALSGHAVYEWLTLQGVAEPVSLAEPDRVSRAPPRSPRRAGTVVAFLSPLLVIAALLGMDRWTISSRTARIRDLPGLLPGDVEDLAAWGVRSPFELAAWTPAALRRMVPGVSADEAAEWIEVSRLATTRGIGTRNARLLYGWGVRRLDDLARVNLAALAECFRNVGPPVIRAPQLRVWRRGAREARGGNGEAGGGMLEPRCPDPGGRP